VRDWRRDRKRREGNRAAGIIAQLNSVFP
jgi:hypothetical protein